jgi:hypothetical protein
MQIIFLSSDDELASNEVSKATVNRVRSIRSTARLLLRLAVAEAAAILLVSEAVFTASENSTLQRKSSNKHKDAKYQSRHVGHRIRNDVYIVKVKYFRLHV